MMKIEVNTTTATLIPPRESLTPGAVNAVQLEFTFSDEWNGLTKTCVFSNEIETVPAELQNDITSVPTEVLDEVYRWISVGVSGEDAEGTVIIPTIWCRIGQCIPGASGRFVTIDMLQAYWSKQEIDLHTEGDGSKFLGDDGVYHYVSQGGGDVTHEELDAALALKADKDAFDALSATVDDKADKSEIITVTTGDGTKYLADDGTYKTITGGGDVTHEELDAAIAPLATKDEVSTAVEPLATKTELASATAGLATTAAMNAALALKADKSELNSYARQYDVNQALATKADKTELDNYETSEHAAATYATKAEIPDVTGFETTAHAEATYATKTELADKADAATVDSALALKADKTELADYETSEHAAATYATKTELTEGLAGKVDTADIADMLTKTEAESTYADKVSMLTLENTVDAQNTRINNLETNKADKTQIITVTSGTGTLFLADDGTYKPAAGDPPDLSAYLTKTEAGTTYTTITHAEATYATKEDMTIADNELQEAIDLKADASALADYETTAHASATYATKAELPDVSDMLTKTEAGTTYATKTELADKADSATVTALSGVVTGHTASIAALESGKADKSELPDVSDMLTKTEAGTTYATKTELDAKADRTQLQGYLTRMEASETYETIARASKIKSITAAGHAVTVTDEGLANVGGTKVSRTTEVPQIGVSNVSVSVQQILPATEESTTGEGGTLPISYTSTTSGALTQYSNFTIDGVPIATKDDVPDVSQFETSAHAAATYQTIADASPIKSITAGGTVVAPDASGNVALTETSIVIATTGTNDYTYINYTPVGSDKLGFCYQYEKSSDNTRSNLILRTTAETNGASNNVQFVRAVTYDEFTAQSSPIKSISQVGSAIPPDASGNVNIHYVLIAAGNKDGKKTLIIRNASENINFGDNLFVEFAENSGKQSDCEMYYQHTDETTQGDRYNPVRIATKDELTDATTTFTHTYTGDAQDNWTVTDVWSGSDGELQKITWKEYAATAGSPGELLYTGTDSATGQKRSVRIATFAELGDLTSGFATMQWVQDYIASLDGTNMSL